LAPDLTICELVQRGRFRFGETTAGSMKVIEPILREAGLSELAERRVTEVSGGELQRALIATLIAQDSPLLLVDEPANHLDPRHQIDAYRRLGRLWEKGHGLCVVTHDIRLCQLLGPTDQVDVIGLSSGAIRFKKKLGDPGLTDDLRGLYGVEFLAQGTPGALGVSLALGTEQRRGT
jgi:iron complex transport system ATP-binding protein